MAHTKESYTFTKISDGARIELHDTLALTGAEVSLNTLPVGAAVPFIHSHKQNEEIYGVLKGSGSAMIDGKRIRLDAGCWLRVSPDAKRQFFASEDKPLTYVCIQVKENSLDAYTVSDAHIHA